MMNDNATVTLPLNDFDELRENSKSLRRESQNALSTIIKNYPNPRIVKSARKQTPIVPNAKFTRKIRLVRKR